MTPGHEPLRRGRATSLSVVVRRVEGGRRDSILTSDDSEVRRQDSEVYRLKRCSLWIVQVCVCVCDGKQCREYSEYRVSHDAIQEMMSPGYYPLSYMGSGQ